MSNHFKSYDYVSKGLKSLTLAPTTKQLSISTAPHKTYAALEHAIYKMQFVQQYLVV